MTAGRSTISSSQCWNTPPNIAELVHKFFVVKLDPCSNEHSIIQAENRYILPTNGLKESWEYENIFINPPYGRDKERKTSIKDWFRKAIEAHSKGSEIVMLVPVATNTTHWKEYVFNKATSICFISEPRVKFLIDGQLNTKGAPMACCVIYYGKHSQKFEEVFKELGNIVLMRKDEHNESNL